MSNRIWVVFLAALALGVTQEVRRGDAYLLIVPAGVSIALALQRCADGARLDGTDLLFAIGFRRRRVAVADIVAVSCDPKQRPVVETKAGSFELSARWPGLADFVATVQRLNPALIVDRQPR